MRRAGLLVTVAPRSRYPVVHDPELECPLPRAREMAPYVEDGALERGLTDYDWVVESAAAGHTVCDLVYARQSFGKVRWAPAVPQASLIQTLADLEGRIVATELVGVTRRRLAERGVSARIEFRWGATEAKLPELADAIAALYRVGLMLNVRVEGLDAVLAVPPALRKPTVSHLSDESRPAVDTILEESVVRRIIPRLKEAGAEGIVELMLNKIVM